MTALELSAAMQAKKIGVAEVLQAQFTRVEQSQCNAFLALAKERAFARAHEIQAKIDAGEVLSPLMGVPIAIKDNISTKDIATTCASKMLQSYVPVFSATAVEHLEHAGMIVLGKLNMDEFAMGGSSETGHFGAVRNPWNVDCVAGGSSGGSAAAVAAGDVPLTLGSDTGGSIRQPCAFCGTTGIKPTYGAVSRYGLVAYASSLDQIGPIGRDINDCAALLEIISAACDNDNTYVMQQPFCFDRSDCQGMRIGLPRNYFASGIADDVKQSVLAAAREFEAAGAHIEEFDMPLMDEMIQAYYVIACAEASSNLSRYDGLKYGYRSDETGDLQTLYKVSRSEGLGLEVKRRIMLGSFVLSSGYYDAYYKKALQVRALIKQAYDELFARFDMILSPVAPTTAYKLGENVDDPMTMYMGDIYTVSVNLAGLPAVSLPCGFDKQGLPVGLQLIGNAFDEAKLVAAARAYQRRTDFHTKLAGGAQ
ncbi:MAG: Asp-tRNA(Asn)/Glu-tRNA(Gln) amidotransferase subunit GatA [Oscillospiraceae bacterium]|nr:Asp-tRNA(Asn)/Glu-tRNA(Gln) amidotransferase subunit GatA [Oscillospiraceae bacterium]